MNKYKIRRPPEQKKILELVKKAQGGDNGAKNLLLEFTMGLILKIIQRYKGIPGIDSDDLMQEGILGMLRALEKFNPKKSLHFGNFAGDWIRAYAFKYIQDSGLVRIPIKTQNTESVIRKLQQKIERKPTLREARRALRSRHFTSVSDKFIQNILDNLDRENIAGSSPYEILSDNYHVESIPDPDDVMSRIQAQLDIANLIKILPTQKQKLITMYYGLNGTCPMSLPEIQKEIGLSTQRISEHILGGIKIMHKFLREHDTNLA